MYVELMFAFHGFIGALLGVLVKAKSFQEIKTWGTVRWLLIGILVGYVYCTLHSDYNFPDRVMTIVAGYFGADFVEAIFSRFKEIATRTQR